jgi:hypothetical protein
MDRLLDLVVSNSGIEWFKLVVAYYRNEAQRMISKGKIDVCHCWCHGELLIFFERRESLGPILTINMTRHGTPDGRDKPVPFILDGTGIGRSIAVMSFCLLSLLLAMD